MLASQRSSMKPCNVIRFGLELNRLSVLLKKILPVYSRTLRLYITISAVFHY